MTENPEMELIQDIAAFQHNPYGYVLYAFPWGEGELAGKEVRVWQKKILIEIGEKLEAGLVDIQEAVQIAIASGHGIGKSALVAWVIMWALSTFEDTKGVVTANTETQLKTKTWAELAKWHRLSINKHWFTFTATAIFSSDKEHEKIWRIDMVPWSERNTEAFAGLHNEGKRVLLIFDEASAIPDAIWEVSEGALTDENTEIIWCVFGNPTRNSGRLRECFRKFKHRWTTRQIDSRDVEGTNKHQLQKWVDDWGIDSDFVKVRVRGMFPSSSFKQFIPTNLVDPAFGKELDPKSYNFAPVIITIDPAWSGEDALVIAKRQGLHFEILDVMPKNDDDVFVAGKVAGYEDEYGADAVFIDLGYGTGIFSAGKAMNRKWILVNFGSKSGNVGCFNKRDEMWFNLREWLKEGGALPSDQELYDEIIGPETVARLDGKIKLESKEDMKKRGLPSPNKADSLALSFAYPVNKKKKQAAAKKKTTRGGGWMG